MGKKNVEANSNNRQCEDDTIVIERFSKKRYETYKAKGIPFKVVCDSGCLCEVKAFDCGVNNDQVLVESSYKFLGNDDVSAFYANQKSGSTQFAGGKLSIYRDEIFFNHGVADFRECVLESEDTRPEISRLIMKCDLDVHLELREKRVRKRVDEINKALGLKE